ncbi:MAG: tetratricopeptide repeat protein, partial [Phycisphaerae bacterium]|nr:tetratricopeptide repeat protein [Phycisphaerae bacterium]
MPELKLADALALVRRERRAGHWNRVETLCRAILDSSPAHHEARGLLAGALRAQGRQEEAIACYRQILHHYPDDARGHNNVANALKEAGAYDEALAAYRRAIELQPDYALAHNNLGVAMFDRQDFDAAEASFRRSIELEPDQVDAHKNLASVFEETGRFEKARPAYETALSLAPDDARLHWNYAQFLLLLGELERGWAEYEWRWRYKGFPGPHYRFARPALADLNVQDRSILVHAEQGIGDTFQFIRYARCLKDRGARVVAALPSVLHRLLSTVPGIDEIT